MKNLVICFCTSIMLFGAYAADDIGAYARKYWYTWGKQPPAANVPAKVSAQELERRKAHYVRCLEEFAPHWLEEFSAIDREFEWQPGTFLKLAMYGIDYKQTLSPHECTSWVIMPELTGGRKLILHKNRDSKGRYIVTQKRSVSGKNAWLGIGNYGNIGTNAGVNSYGVAVVMNSGDKTMDNSVSGFNTVEIARILLEECRSADAALELLKKILAAGAYKHGDKGSIWYIADADVAYVVENNARNLSFRKIKSGFSARANAWHLPEMLPYSRQISKKIVGNVRREYALREALLHNIVQKGQTITPGDIAAASRISKLQDTPNTYPICGKLTVSGSTFVIDREFPADLTCAYFTLGSPRYTVYIPVPLTLGKLPDELMNGKFSKAVFARFDRGKEPDQKLLQAVETEMAKIYEDAENRARIVLKKGGKTARQDAAAILAAAFEKNWELVQKSGL